MYRLAKDLGLDVDDFERNNSDMDFQDCEYVTSDSEDDESNVEKDVAVLQKKFMEIQRENKRLKIIIMQLRREIHENKLDNPITPVISHPRLIVEEEEDSRTKYVYELTPGYVTTIYKCHSTGNITTTTPPSLLLHKEFLDLPDDPLEEPPVPTNSTYIWISGDGHLHSGSSSFDCVTSTLSVRLKKIYRTLQEKIDKLETDDDGDEPGDDDTPGGWCWSTYLDVIVYQNDINFDTVRNIVGCGDAATAEAINRVIRWFTCDRDRMTNINLQLPKMMSLRFVKFLLAISEIGSFSLSFPQNHTLIIQDDCLPPTNYLLVKYTQDLERMEYVMSLLKEEAEAKENRRANGFLTFREQFLERLDATGSDCQKIADYVGEPFTDQNIYSYYYGKLPLVQVAKLEPLLKQWMDTPDGQIKNHSRPRAKRERKKKSSERRLNRCSHCEFSHRNQKVVDKHVYDSHGVYPYICSVCGKGRTYHNHFLKHLREHDLTSTSK